MSRTQQLAKEIQELIKGKKFSLEWRGPLGGTNARLIEGWSQPTNGTISKACKMAGVPTMNWWSGSLPTPTTAIPTQLVGPTYELYLKIFKGA